MDTQQQQQQQQQQQGAVMLLQISLVADDRPSAMRYLARHESQQLVMRTMQRAIDRSTFCSRFERLARSCSYRR